MKIFNCPCGDNHPLFFENSRCLVCDDVVGFSWSEMRFVFESSQRTRCANWTAHDTCNSFVEDDEPEGLCPACRLNKVIPDLSIDGHRDLWRKIEEAKRRCLFGLKALGLPFEDPHSGLGLQFEFKADAEASTHFTRRIKGTAPVLTGHENGVITLNLAEADDVARTRIQESLGENYRTLLGHLRHEVGHYYWEVLVQPFPERLHEFRRIFGNEQTDYAEALERHYAKPQSDDWQSGYVSFYATMHPWEDWAETWAHYMHMVDAVQTAQQYRLSLTSAAAEACNTSDIELSDFGSLSQAWIDISSFLNSLNRSMGLQDAYPFVVTEPVLGKLQFIHEVVRGQADSYRDAA